MFKPRFRLASYLLLVGGLWALPGSRTMAQSNIVPDQSLGTEGSQVVPNVDGSTNDEIQGGAKRGANLFHSFREFNIDAGRGAYFANPTGVNNILTRVTGDSLSNISGTLGVSGNANLFLMNPNGILFGPSSSLDIKGSFLSTTANAIQFGNQGDFSTTESAIPTPLTVQPSALLFNQINSTPIENQSTTGLKVPRGRSLSLVGGDVVIDGGQLNAPGGRIELGGLATPGTIGLNTEENLFQLSFSDETFLADISLDNGAKVDVSADSIGSIIVHADQVNVSGSSDVLAEISKNLGEIDTQASKTAINIQANSLQVTDGSVLSADNFGIGNAGDIEITARDQIVIDGEDTGARSSKVINRVLGEGKGGDIEIDTGRLLISNGAFVSTNNRGTNNSQSGNISIKAQEKVELLGVGPEDDFPSGIYSRISKSAIGDSGNINLTVTEGSLSVTDGAEINVITAGEGNAGNIDIDVRDRVRLDGEGPPRRSDGGINSSGIFSGIESTGIGDGGKINLSAGSLVIQNGAFISANTNSDVRGNAGDIIINVQDNISLRGIGDTPSGIRSQVAEDAKGNAGNIDLTVTEGSLSVTDGAEVNVITTGEGNAGNIDIDVRDGVRLDGEGPPRRSDGGINSSGIFSGIESIGIGNGGTINLSAGSLLIQNGAFISANTDSDIRGNAGDITINVQDNVSLRGVGDTSSGIRSQVARDAKGNAGNIHLTVIEGFLSVTDGAEINTTVLPNAVGNAGTIRIEAPERIVLSGVGTVRKTINSSGIFSGIRRNAQGNAGSIVLSTSSLLAQNGAHISTSSGGRGNAGTVVVNAQNSISLKGFGSDGFPSGIYSQTQARGGQIGNGEAGNISLNVPTGLISVSDEALVSTKTSRKGKAGNITLTANTLEAINGGQIVTNTLRNGNAGNINLEISDNIILSGNASTYIERLNKSDDNVSGVGPESGLFANTLGDSTGDSGSISSDFQIAQTTIQNGATIAVDNRGTGKGGDISFKTGSLTLDQGTILAETASNQGGDIDVDVNNLLILRNSSLISATAGTSQAEGNGGNIDIDTALLVAFPQENSDITANAFEGKGGNIQITAQGVFGTAFRDQLTPSSDITASSNFGTDGTVQLDTSLDPTSGLVDLPVQPPQPQQVAQTCTPGSSAQGEFVYTGRGGLPPTSQQVLNQRNIDLGWVGLDPKNDNKHQHPLVANSQSAPPVESKRPQAPQPVEAQGWTTTQDGTVQLTASTTTAPHHLAQRVCPGA